MTLEHAKNLLQQNNISFHQTAYLHEADFWRHISPFPYTANAKQCKVVALVILSNNGEKNIELQFNETLNGFEFEELWFGQCSYDMFGTPDDFLPEEIIFSISEIMQCKYVFMIANDLKNQCLIGYSVFDYEDTGDWFGITGYQKALRRIEAPQNIFSKIFGSKKQYEIYDWNTYRSIIK